MTWTQFYWTKQAQRRRGGRRCEWCGQGGPTHSHHLFARRPDHAYLQDDINIVQLCAACHHAESRQMQVGLAAGKLDRYGPDAIEQWAADAPFKLPLALPSHYWAAKERWLRGHHPGVR